MCTQLTTMFESIKAWRNYCFSTHSLYLKNIHFRKWVNQKEISIFNFSNLNKEDIKCMKLGMEDAIKLAKRHFKVTYGDGNSVKDILNLTDEKINSKKLLKMIIEKRIKNHKEQANVFIFNNPIRSPSAVIKDGEALTYVSEGITIFSFDTFKKYPCSFLMRRAKHEALHMLGLNAHHEDTKVRGYNDEVPCVMKYNAPAMKACGKCKDALAYFWNGIEYATKKQFVKN